MGVSFEVKGGDGLRAVARACREVSREDLTRELVRGLRSGAKDVEAEVRAHTDDYMPRGYEEIFRAHLEFRTEVRKSYDYRVTVIGSAKGRSRARHVRQMEAGELRKPVYGRWRRRRGKNRGKHAYRNPWRPQRIRPHWMTEPAERAAPTVRRTLDRHMQKIADKIEKAG